MNEIDHSVRRSEPHGHSNLSWHQGGVRAARYAGSKSGHDTRLEDDDALNLRRVVWGLMKRRRQICAVVAVVVIPVAAATALAERLYRASAMVQIDSEPVQVLPYREIDLPNLAPNYEMFMRSQEQILRGSALMSRIVARLQSDAGPESGITRDEVPKLGGRLWLERVENTQIFRLGYLAGSPTVAAKIANIYAEEYLKLHFDARQQTREKARQQLEAELRALEERVRSSETELGSYAQAHGIWTSDNAKSLIAEKLSALSSELTEAETNAVAAQSRLDSLKSASAEAFPERLMTPVISNLVSRLASLEHERTALRATFGPNWVSVVQKDKEIAVVREQLQREKSATLEQARQQALLDIRAAEAARRLVAASILDQQQLANKLDVTSIQYNMIKGEADKNRKLYDGVLEQLQKTSVTAGMEFGGVRVIEQALPPQAVDSPRPLWNLSLAALFGLALGVGIAFLRDSWDTSVTTVEEVEQLELIPILGTLPLTSMPSASQSWLRGLRRRLPRTTDRAHLLAVPEDVKTGSRTSADAIDLPANPIAAEDMRTICASLLLSRSDRPPRVLLVTSAAPGEGKTTVATALAQTLADTGASTLLVDCDVRRGRIGSIFDIAADGGLTLFLAGHLGSAPTIHATGNDRLFVVTSGPSAPNPPALLGSERMQAFLTDVKSSFQFVILDAPPVMPLADARVLAHMAEGVLLVVRAGQVPKSMLRRACAYVEAAGGTMLGAVFNGADDRSPGSEYRYYHDYYRT